MTTSLSAATDPDTLPRDVPGEATFVEANGRTFHVVEAGPEGGDLVLLLHGFPEFWYGWHDQIRPLVNEGYRVVVPDQRGYNRSERPGRVRDYRIEALSADVTGLIDAYDRETAAVVGHDWGGVVGWWTALHSPGRLSSFVAVNAPHPTVIRQTLTSDPAQLLRSGYAAFFQLPKVPEALTRAANWRLPVAMMRESSMPGTFSTQDFDRYRAAWRKEGAFTAMLNWYRAAARRRPEPEADEVAVPTRLIWGVHDQFLKHRMAYDSVDHCADGRITNIQEATHWVHHEQPVKVADVICDELA
ncbi:alpha/beta fold hydrolase [Halobaculum gomorrense]|uniref:Pimeloyl-ACP methyl ester carboxylesterase n=1 Tax=Halobaculum gomorrense TaxID=43928 RepID=A0A1M5MPE1_9EURY|nr:alpha/beta hydrolase [Halobaculum gomorrense]SHG79274.1 Pimeloyl-ACP methyl ester carboxylesterase [Halobaculum gomorrense]